MVFPSPVMCVDYLSLVQERQGAQCDSLTLQIVCVYVFLAFISMRGMLLTFHVSIGAS